MPNSLINQFYEKLINELKLEYGKNLNFNTLFISHTDMTLQGFYFL